MGGKDTPPLQYASTSPPQSPLWERKTLPSQLCRNKSSVDLDMRVSVQKEQSAPQWHSAPSSPDQQARSPRSSSRSSGTVSPIRQYMECFEPQTLSCALVGDSGVGKTSLLLSYTTGTIPKIPDPTIYDKFSSKFAIALMQIKCKATDIYSSLSFYCSINFSLWEKNCSDSLRYIWTGEYEFHCRR